MKMKRVTETPSELAEEPHTDQPVAVWFFWYQHLSISSLDRTTASLLTPSAPTKHQATKHIPTHFRCKWKTT